MPIRTAGPLLYPRLGRISLGYTVVKMEGDKPVLRGGQPVIYPRRSNTFVFHSDEKDRLDVVAAVFGGKVEEAVSKDEEGGAWRVVTDVSEIEVIVPADDERGFDTWLEKWTAGGLLRRCDGVKATFAVDDDGKVWHNVPCVCEAQGLDGEDRCDPVTRLNVFIKALDMAPGIGVWQVQSRGWGTYRALAATIDLLMRVGRFAMVPLVLKATMREIRTVEEGHAQTRKVPVITLTTRESFADAMARQMDRYGHPALPAVVPGPDRTKPPLGAVLTDAQRYEAERATLDERLTSQLQDLQMSGRTARVIAQRVTGKTERRDFTIADYQRMSAVLDAMAAGATLDEALDRIEQVDQPDEGLPEPPVE